MTEILLQELTNTDIDWLVTAGQQQQIAAGTFVIRPGERIDFVYLLLNGLLSVTQQNGKEAQEIMQILRGDIVGLPTLLENRSARSAVKAIQNSTVLAIPRRQLAEKLQQDIFFSAHLHRAIALILSERIRQILEMPERLQLSTEQPVKKALFVFGEMQDSDIDWLVSAGQVKKLSPDEVLLHAGRPVDALYIILDGLLSVSAPEGNYDPLSLCFLGLEKRTRNQKVFANISKGEMPGIFAFLDSRQPMTVRAIHESLVFAVPRAHLTIKLHQDLGFASRFYRVIAIQVAELLSLVMDRLGCDRQTYDQQNEMDQDKEYGDELGFDALQQMSQGANRFNWMLKRLGIGYSII